jgi:hypothetical protein
MLNNSREVKPALHDLVYDRFLAVAHKELTSGEMKGKSKSDIFFINQYTELLSTCCKSHGARIRYFLIREQIIQGLLSFFDLNNKLVSISVIKLLKSVILSKDEFLVRDLINKELFDRIYDVFCNCGSTKNMVYSCFLDLFESIFLNKVELLIDYMVSLA